MPRPPQTIGGGARPLDVTVTILSLSGLHAKEGKKKKASTKPKKFSGRPWWQRQASPDDATEATAEESCGPVGGGPVTTVVASYERPLPGHVGVMTHVPSLPLPPILSRKKTALPDDVRWPEQAEGAHSKVSTISFRKSFSIENTGQYEPQICPIQVCVSRNGNMFRLGSAHLIVNGDEREATNVDVPVVDFDSAFEAAPPTKGGKVALKRLRGETLQCGLADLAALRVLVTVSDPSAFVLAGAPVVSAAKANVDASDNESISTTTESVATEVFDDEDERAMAMIQEYVRVETVNEGAVSKEKGNSVEMTKALSPASSSRKIPGAVRDRRDDDSHDDSVSTTGASSDASTNVGRGRRFDRMTNSFDSEESSLSGDLLRLINDVAQKTRTTGVSMSASVQSYRRKRAGERDEDDSTVWTNTSASVGRSPFPGWGRRLVCCAGPGCGARAGSGRAKAWLMESIDEGDSYHGSRGYCLEGREPSGGSYSRGTTGERSGYDF